MPDPLTPWLTEVKARLAKATPGPWHHDYPNIRDANGKLITGIAKYPEDWEEQVARPNGDFITHAPADLTRAVRVMKAGQSVLNELQAMGILRNESPSFRGKFAVVHGDKEHSTQSSCKLCDALTAYQRVVEEG